MAAGLAIYGAYKTGALNSLSISRGKSVVDSVPSNEWTQKLQSMLKDHYQDLSKASDLGRSAQDSVNKAFESLKNQSNRISEIGSPSRITEKIQDSLMKANPLYGYKNGTNNCIPSSIAGIMRTLGYDVTAKGTGGKQLNPGGIVEECFKKVRVLDGSAKVFGKSRSDAESMLLKRFGQNARGIVNIQTKAGNGEGHCFSWIINNGVVNFYDFQKGWDNSTVSSFWGKVIDPNGSLTLARLDNAEIDFNALRKYVNF